MTAAIKAKAGSMATALSLSALPIDKAKNAVALGAVLLSGDGERLHIATTSLAATITTSIDAEAKGELALPLQRLTDLVATFPADAEVVIRANDNVAVVGCGRSKFKLPMLADLPPRHLLEQETGRVDLDAQTVRDLIARLSFAISREETRFYLNGLFLGNVEGELLAIATDGLRLVQLATATSSTLSTDRRLIIPREILRTIQRLLAKATGSITLRRSERSFSIEGAAFQLTGRLIDGEFPSTTRYTKLATANVVTTNRARLLESLERFEAVAEDTRSAVNLRWNGSGLCLSTADGSSDHLSADVTGVADVSARIRYFREIMLEAMGGDRVAIATGRPGNPIVIRDPDDSQFIAVQMPVIPPSGDIG